MIFRARITLRFPIATFLFLDILQPLVALAGRLYEQTGREGVKRKEDREREERSVAQRAGGT